MVNLFLAKHRPHLHREICNRHHHFHYPHHRRVPCSHRHRHRRVACSHRHRHRHRHHRLQVQYYL